MGKIEGISGYYSWRNLRARCYEPKHAHYEYYGGRGITVCERWRSSFRAFLVDMGPRPTRQHSIDRIDSNGNYEPGNCRWATHVEQNRNSRWNRLVEFQGRTMSLAEACEITGLSHSLVHNRLSDNWTAEKALTTPPKLYKKRQPRTALTVTP